MEIYWICGSVCAGKTTVARRVAYSANAKVYHFDAHERDHLRRLGRDEMILENLAEEAARRGRLDERWLHRTPSEMASRTTRTWTDRFPLVVEDLNQFKGTPVIAEGSGLFPWLLGQGQVGNVIALLAHPAFLRHTRFARGMAVPQQTSDPGRAAENIIARDLLMAQQIRSGAEAAGIPVINIDGSTPIESVAARVERHFGFSR